MDLDAARETRESLVARAFRDRVMELCRFRGMAFEEVATRAGLTPPEMEVLQTMPHNVDLDTMARLAQALEVEVADLVALPLDGPLIRALAKVFKFTPKQMYLLLQFIGELRVPSDDVPDD